MIKQFLNYYKPHRKLFIADIMCAVLLALCNMFYPISIRLFINDYVPNKKLSMIIATVVALFIIYIIKYGLNHFIQYWGHIMGVRIQCDIRQDAFNHLQKLPFSFFDKTRAGSIMSRIINDTEHIAEFAHHGPEDFLISVVSMLGAFIYLLTVNVPLTLIIFCFIPILVVFSMKRRIVLRDRAMESRIKVGEVNSNLENSIAGVRVSKAYDSSDTELRKFEKGNKAFEQAKSLHYKAMADFFSGTNFIIDMLSLVTVLSSGLFAYYGKINMVDFTTYILFIASFSEPIRKLIGFIEQLQNGSTGFERVTELMAEKTEEDSPNAVELKDVKGDIEFRDVTFMYDNSGEHVFKNLNLKIPDGQTLALVGPSGGGKSTLCHLLPRFYEVDSGDILIDGNSIKKYTRLSLREKIGIVQQDTFLFTGTIKENIAYGNFKASDQDIINAAKLAKIHDFIMSLPEGYDTFIGERGVMLSGGQKQRISISRIFLKNPPILILDEATSALDNTTELAIQESLNELSQGRTTMVVAHRLSTIMNADQIAYIADNKILEKGTYQELIEKDGYYAKLWKAQQRI